MRFRGSSAGWTGGGAGGRGLGKKFWRIGQSRGLATGSCAGWLEPSQWPVRGELALWTDQSRGGACEWEQTARWRHSISRARPQFQLHSSVFFNLPRPLNSHVSSTHDKQRYYWHPPVESTVTTGHLSYSPASTHVPPDLELGPSDLELHGCPSAMQYTRS